MDFITSNLFIIISSLASLLFLILLLLHVRLEIRIRKMLKGNSVKNLENLLIKINEEMASHAEFENETKDYFKNLEKRISTSIRGVEAVTFNAFSGIDSGGNSFATAIINEKGDGIIISSLKSRDHLNVFTKKIIDGKSVTQLSTEEQDALTKALKSCSL